jgi:hypothetical protein
VLLLSTFGAGQVRFGNMHFPLASLQHVLLHQQMLLLLLLLLTAAVTGSLQCGGYTHCVGYSWQL